MVFAFRIPTDCRRSNPFLWPALPEMVYDLKLTAAHAQPEPFIAERLGYCAHGHNHHAHSCSFLSTYLVMVMTYLCSKSQRGSTGTGSPPSQFVPSDCHSTVSIFLHTQLISSENSSPS